jgi:hypothetical protein
MRPKNMAPTMAEIMGKSEHMAIPLGNQGVGLEHSEENPMHKEEQEFHEKASDLLGDKKPDIPFDRVGRYRLGQALMTRFGANYHQIPAAKALMDHHDSITKVKHVIKANRGY